MPTEQTTKPNNSLLIPIARTNATRCTSQHLGAWAIESKWFKAGMDSIRNGLWKPKAFDDDDDFDESCPVATPNYVVQDGVAIISIDGQMTKGGSSFGGCSTVEVRQAVRSAAKDYIVKAILLHICSPGGTVSGTADLADDVVAAGRIKPVVAYIEDLGCSAAYWVASQCRTIYANTTALVGSIGTYAILEDDTGLQEQVGIKYRVVSTGEYKGLGADGTVSDKLVADVQREVNELNASFLAAVEKGRGDKIADIPAIADGRVHVSAQALKLGLIDEVASLDVAMSALTQEVIMTAPIMSADAFKAYAAANPEDPTVKELIGQGKSAGIAEGKKTESDRIKSIVEACGDNHAIAIEAIVGGHTPDSVKLAVKTALNAKATVDSAAKANAEILAKKDAELVSLRDKVNFLEGGQGTVATRGTTQQAAPATDAAAVEANAKEAWAKNTGGCRDAFIDEATYIATMKAEAHVK